MISNILKTISKTFWEKNYKEIPLQVSELTLTDCFHEHFISKQDFLWRLKHRNDLITEHRWCRRYGIEKKSHLDFSCKQRI